MDTGAPSPEPVDHTAAVAALREAFASLIAAEDIDLLPNEGDGGDEIALAGERWTLYLEGWPGPEIAFVAVEDEPDEDAPPEKVEAAWRKAVPDGALTALRATDATLGGALSAALRVTGDPISAGIAAAIGDPATGAASLSGRDMAERSAASVAPADVPVLVERARAAATACGFTRSCTDDVGRVLRLLAAAAGSRTIGEIGTGCGAGAAWLASGMADGARLVTVERDVALAAVAREVLSGQPDAAVLTGDWRDLLAHGPFGLLFVDVADAKAQPDTLLAAMAPGGIVVLDDLTPEEHWPDEWHGNPDPLREAWLNHPGLLAAELRDTATTALILATKRHDDESARRRVGKAARSELSPAGDARG